MPFTGPGDDSLPDHVKELSREKRNQFVGAFNGRFADCEKDGGSTSECESSAFAVANAAVKELGQKGGQVDDPTGGGQSSGTTSMRDGDGDKGPDNQGQKFDDSPSSVDRYYEFLSRQVLQEQANYNPIGGTDTKACANCQWFIAPTSCAVVTEDADTDADVALVYVPCPAVAAQQCPLLRNE